MSTLLHRIIDPFRHTDVVEGTPLDKLQLDAANDRLKQRSEELTRASDELTNMIKRLKRRTMQ